MPNTWVFVAVCAVCGALSIPVHPLATPLNALIGGVVGYLGLKLWRWSRLPSATRPKVGPFEVAGCFAVGVMVGLLVLLAIRFYFEPAVPAAGARIAAAGMLPVWRRLLIIYVAAVGEELVFRLLLLSAIAGVLMRLVQRGQETPSRQSILIANILCALAFGAVHLPAWTAIGPLSTELIVMVVMLNGVVGLVLGHVFATRGIVAAMWLHAGGDCAIQLIGPLT
jgi:membrane protease YdiL (CAAX protease family)